MDEKLIAKQLTEVTNLTDILCSTEPIDRKLLKKHKKNIGNLIRGYKNIGNPSVRDFEAAYSRIVSKLESIN